MADDGRKKSIFKRWWFWLIVIIIIIIIAASCNGGNDNNASNTNNNAATTENNNANDNNQDTENKSAKEKASEAVHKIGDTVNINGVNITITSAKFTQPNQYTESKNGKIITFEVTAENKSDNSQVLVDNTEFTISDKDGNMGEDYYGYDQLAISGEINKGKKLTGKLYFDVTDSDKYELQYQPMFSLSNKTYTWEINKSELQ